MLFPSTISTQPKSKLLSPVIFIFSTLLTIVVTILCSIPIVLIGAIKLFAPLTTFRQHLTALADFMMCCWCKCLAVLLRINHAIEWDIEGLKGLKKHWYLLIAIYSPQKTRLGYRNNSPFLREVPLAPDHRQFCREFPFY